MLVFMIDRSTLNYNFTSYEKKIDLQELELHFTSIETMRTDILTKSLPKPKHGLCFQALGLYLTPP